MPTDALLAKGYTSSEIDTIKNYPIEEKLLELASIPAQELSARGYSDKQISLLKIYNGEPINENSPFRGIFADLTVTPKNLSASPSSIKISYSWNWSNAPALTGTAITESIGLGFSGTNSQSSPMNVKITSSSINVQYYYNGTRYDDVNSYDIKISDATSFVKCNFPAGIQHEDRDGLFYAFAMKGTLTATFSPVASGNNLHAVTTIFGYDHIAVGDGISTSISGGILGFGFNFSGFKMYDGCIIFYSNGSYEDYS